MGFEVKWALGRITKKKAQKKKKERKKERKKRKKLREVMNFQLSYFKL